MSFNSTANETMQPNGSQTWATTLGLHLNQAMLETQLYTADQINKHMHFFYNYVALWLGPGPQSQQIGRKPAYPSALTSDHTPLEVSYSWKRATHASVAVRFVVDIIPQDGDLRPAASLLAGMQAISTLNSLHAAGTVLGLSNLWSTVATRLRSFDRTIHTDDSTCAHCCPSTTFVGFDLSPASASSQAKLYWLLPSCQRVPTLVAELDALVATCITENHFENLAGFGASWALMRDYLEGESSTLRPRMLSIDATKYPFPRLKLYNRVHFDINRPFDDILSHLTLGGLISKPVGFIAQCRTLWDTLMKHYQQNPNSSYQDYCMVEYEIRPLALLRDGVVDVSLDSKLYLFCDRTPEHDIFVTRALLGQFEGPSSFLERPDIKSRFSSKSAYVKEIGLAARGEDTEIAAYISPCVFSADP